MRSAPAWLTRGRLLVWLALAFVVLAWLCKGVSVATREAGLAAQALYFSELARQRDATPDATSPTVEAIATQVHRRAVRQLGWIGAGLALCALAAFCAGCRVAAIAASCALFVGGWLLLDGYAHVGLFLGLDLKLRLVHGDWSRLREFLVFDALLPAAVAATGFASLVALARGLTA